MNQVIETITKIFTPENILFMLNGVKISLIVAICCVTLGTILGIIICSMKISTSKFLNILANIYVELIRGTPMLLQLSFFYLGIPMLYQMITGNYLAMNSLTTGIIAISINSGAYSCELKKLYYLNHLKESFHL